MNYVVIDFETAGPKRDTPCELGICEVVDGEIVSNKSWLIKPACYPSFGNINMAIHGIKPADVADKEEFDELWPEIYQSIEGKVIVAHNTSFDISVLTRTLIRYELEIPEFEYLCTLQLAKIIWPNRSGYKLNQLCDSIGFKFEHHKAKEDCLATARLLNYIIQESGLNGIRDLEKFCGLGLSKISKFGQKYRVPSKKRVASSQRIEISSQKISNKLDGARIVISGVFEYYSRNGMKLLIEQHGGINVSSISKKTDFLVAGESMGPAKKEKAEKLGVKMISEQEFANMIG